MLVIVTELRSGQWTAYPESLPDIRITGRTQAEAVGRLLVAKTRRLPVQIKRVEAAALEGESSANSQVKELKRDTQRKPPVRG
jgi:hypothetical protein